MSLPPSVVSQGLVGRIKGNTIRNLDGANISSGFRQGMYGEEYNLSLVNKAHLLADEGSYFVASNPTAGAGVASAAAPTVAPAIGSNDTKPFLVYQNKDGTGGKRTYFDYIRFRCTAPGTGGTAINFVVILDTNQAPRAPAGGTVITPVNPNIDDGSVSVGSVMAGAVTVATTSS